MIVYLGALVAAGGGDRPEEHGAALVTSAIGTPNPN